MEIPTEVYERIAAEITSDASPVGIDAKKTHIMILYKLVKIEERLERLERLHPPVEFGGDGHSGSTD